jgi:glycine C-acetyltransferase
MSLESLETTLRSALDDLDSRGLLKASEAVVTGFKAGENGYGPRVYLSGQGEKLFLRMNSNSYLGLSRNPAVIEAGEAAAKRFGAGPGAVRFISGTYQPHVELEKRLAAFHGREDAMLFSAAYSAVIGVLPQLITNTTVVVSDELNHNCIINAVRLARPGGKVIYPHLSMPELSRILREQAGKFRRAIVVTDGIFSMRGEFAPLDEIAGICKEFDAEFEEGILTVVDDSHGVGAFGLKGRGTEEHTSTRADILIATLGKAFGVNGGYVTSSRQVIRYLRETAPFYIYSNPITPSEAAAALKSLEIVDSHQGLKRLEKLRTLTRRLEEGIRHIGLETLSSPHPIVPLLIRDTDETTRRIGDLFDKGILATGLKYPVVPKGEEEIRFQVSADHTEKDINLLLETLRQ